MRYSLIASAVMFSLAVSREVQAHAEGASSGVYTSVDSRTLSMALVFARSEAAQAWPQLDRDHDGHVTAVEVTQSRAEFEGILMSMIHVVAGERPCVIALTDLFLTEGDALRVEARARCDAGLDTQALSVDLRPAFSSLRPGHRHLARIEAAGVGTEGAAPALREREATITEQASSFDVVVADARARPRAELADPLSDDSTLSLQTARNATATTSDSLSTAIDFASARQALRSFWAIVRMGAEHVALGYDHIAFLLGLAAVPATKKRLLLIATAFTVAHALTLGVTAMIWALRGPEAQAASASASAVVEPAIALTVLAVGLETLGVWRVRARALVAFAFGLVHGLGFATALGSLELTRMRVATSLVAFNVGVELAQAMLVAAFGVAFEYARRCEGRVRRVDRAAGYAVTLAGAWWFVVRAWGR